MRFLLDSERLEMAELFESSRAAGIAPVCGVVELYGSCLPEGRSRRKTYSSIMRASFSRALPASRWRSHMLA